MAADSKLGSPAITVNKLLGLRDYFKKRAQEFAFDNGVDVERSFVYDRYVKEINQLLTDNYADLLAEAGEGANP